MISKFVLILVYFILIFQNNYIESNLNAIHGNGFVVYGNSINVLNQTIYEYLGIPFAEPPIGELRFAKPLPLKKNITIITNGTLPSHSCMQLPDPFVKGSITISEDCLTLNVWTQNKSDLAKLKPVMFWIYGGGNIIGSIFQDIYNGSVLATNDIVFVSANYRLAKFGFLYGADDSAPGNVALFDQVLALQWVRDNIHYFGGNKNQITIFGESAGSYDVSALLLSPHSKGLFKRAIMQSGAQLYNKDRPIVTKEEALLAAKQTAKQLNCTDDRKWLDCLRKVDAKELLGNDINCPIDGTEFLPLSTNRAFNESKFNKDIDLIAGVTRDEGSMPVPYEFPEVLNKNFSLEQFNKILVTISQSVHNLNIESIKEFYLNNTNTNDSNAIKWKLYDFYGDLMIKCPTYLFAKRYAKHSSPETNVFFYELTHSSRGKQYENEYGITHTSDLDFVFGLLLLKANTSTEDIKFSKQVVKLWTDFAKFGKPDPKWPKLIDTKSNSSVTQIKDLNPVNSNKYFTDLFGETCDGFWKNYF